MSSVAAWWRALPPWVRRFALPTLVVALAFLYPYYIDGLPGAFPELQTSVIILAFTMMAVGLNIVVGYAGLLDLGYVAFYATGAYTAAWFTSLQFPHTTWHFGAVGKFLEFIPGNLGLLVPWMPCFIVLPFLCFLVAGASVAAGGGKDLPLMVLAALKPRAKNPKGVGIA